MTIAHRARLLLLIGASIPAFASSALAAPDETAFRLQERCGNDAAAFFVRQKKVEEEAEKPYKDPGPHTSSSGLSDYISNYSAQMNGCFILMTEATGYITTYALYDVNTNRQLGIYGKIDGGSNPQNPLPHMCIFNGVECSTEAEWRALITPYVPPPSDR